MTWLTLMLSGVLLTAAPVTAALPWLAATDPELSKQLVRKRQSWGLLLGGTAAAGVLLGLFLFGVRQRDSLEIWGRLYGGLLQLLLTADLFVVLLGGVLWLWPRGGAVALAAFREAVRQPLFWLLAGGGAFLMVVWMILPYFTFGDDFKMMKQLDFDTVMLFGTLFVVITAALSIGEEIEGRTAITVLSKPLSRRQFLLGKFAGILLAGLLLTVLLGWWLAWCLYLKPIIDPNEEASDPLQTQLLPSLQNLAGTLAATGEVSYFLQGAARWFADSLSVLPGLLVGFGQVMLFLGVASALATRLPLVVNLGVCLALFFLGNLAPILLQTARRLEQQYQRDHPGSTSATLELVQFTARLLDTVLPALEYFGIGPAIIRDRPLPLGPYLVHVGLTTGYSIFYTAIALLLGLILFEDRDVA